MNEEQIGQILKEARKQAGLTQLAIAEQLELPKSIISRIENGRANVTIKTLNKIAEALNCDLIIQFQKR